MKKRWRLLALSALIVVAACPFFLWRAWGKYNSLPAWIDRVRRPGYELLYSTETADGSYYAIFDAGNDHLALCHYLQTNHPATTERFTDNEGESLIAAEDRHFASLSRVYGLGVVTYVTDDGEELAIRPGYRGNIRVVRQTWEESAIVLLDATISWHEDR